MSQILEGVEGVICMTAVLEKFKPQELAKMSVFKIMHQIFGSYYLPNWVTQAIVDMKNPQDISEVRWYGTPNGQIFPTVSRQKNLYITS